MRSRLNHFYNFFKKPAADNGTTGLEMVELSNSRNSLPGLPGEIVLLIFSRLSLRDGATVATLNKKTRSIYYDRSLWKSWLQQDFPYHFQYLNTRHNVDWHQEYIKAYQYDYQNIPGDKRELFSLVKCGQIDALTKCPVLYNDFDLYDARGVSLIKWAAIKRYQPVLDHLYQIALLNYRGQEHIIQPGKVDYLNRTLLHWAVTCRQPLQTIKDLCTSGIDPGWETNFGETVLHCAVDSGHIEALQWLLTLGIKLTNDHEALIHRAARIGDDNVINFLIEQKAAFPRHGSEALSFAAANGHLETVKLLVAYGAKINPQLGDDCIMVPVVEAVASQSPAMLEFFLLNGASANSTFVNLSPLHYAAHIGNSYCAETLLKHNAQVNRDIDGCTPLTEAAKSGHLAVVKLLIRHGAVINDRDHQCAALYFACLRGHYDVAEYLLKNGANASSQNKAGYTCLDAAASNRNAGIVNLLLEYKVYNMISTTIKRLRP